LYEDCPLNFRFNDDPFLEKKILPQYDDPAAEEVCYSCCIPKKDELGSFCEFIYSLDSFIQGVTLDEKGRFSGQAEKKLEEVNYAFVL